ncbi:hypothetical protein IQ270_05865 [Microcoleus sp. LEGE 07076]|nr:hypothetical protein [Microcoleus sp. LEGE 07076]MBE9184259.1 hypothetical protein [Microcoleus sp. LEGE 07076]
MRFLAKNAVGAIASQQSISVLLSIFTAQRARPHPQSSHLSQKSFNAIQK